MEFYLDWINFKNLFIQKNIPIQFIETGGFYKIFIQEGIILYRTDIFILTPPSVDQLDFENNYKNQSNKQLHPKDDNGKEFVRAESRPLNMTTYFTMAGDSVINIGDGNLLIWDFSNENNIISAPQNYKRKRIEFKFLDGIRIKEGTIYWKDKIFGSYIDLYVVCPQNNFYLDNTKTPQFAEEDTIVEHFVNKHHMMGDCVIGDELNTEAASDEIPSNYKFWLEITVPDTDNLSKGHVSIELYRPRTVVL